MSFVDKKNISSLKEMTLVAGLDGALTQVLLTGEKIVWSAQPDGALLFRRAWILVAFAVLWTSFSLVWTGMALASALVSIHGMLDVPVLMIPMLGLIFVGVGVLILKFCFAIPRNAKSSFYIVTNFRAMIMNVEKVDSEQRRRLSGIDMQNFTSSAVTSFWAAEMTEPVLRADTKLSNRFDLLFVKRTDSDGAVTMHGFDAFEDAAGARQYIENLIKNRTSLQEHHRQTHESAIPGFDLPILKNKFFGFLSMLFVVSFIGLVGSCIFVQESVKADIRKSDRAIQELQFDEAQGACERALALLDAAPKMATPRTFRAHLLENLAKCHLQFGDGKKSLPLLLEAIALRESVIESPGEDESVYVQQRYLKSDKAMLTTARSAR